MPAIILSIGDELTLGQTVDTNSAWVSAQLAGHGITTQAHQTVADDKRAIEQAIRWACSEADLVIISGGIGPTEDDLTRFALADAMGVGLVEHAGAMRTLEDFFRGRGRPMPEKNRVQAMLPQGATLIPNANGTAPGMRCRVGRAEVFVVPGVPREMRPMVIETILPATAALNGSGQTILTAKINTFGAGESTVAERLGDLMDRQRNPVVGTTVSDGIVSVRVRAEYADNAEAGRACEATCATVESALGPIVFGRNEQTLQQAVVELLRERGQTVATAESCTGGLIGAMLTEVPGSSAAYAGGWVTYSNDMKMKQLGVDAGTLAAEGAVSEAVVKALASGALERSGATLAIAVSGIAGPDGGTADKPVGTVWFALARREGQAVHTEARQALLPGQREVVRDRAAKCALQWLRFHLLGLRSDQLSWFRGPGQ